ncbi:MAG TPA: hypothetical protein VHW71_03420 [Steroidobacteraceae bacterium]|jgi:hypothetical protein|nr:hypothetical protein [Steroidobacteraceae bacterium]
MRTISFKNTALFKRGIWLSAAALIAFVAGPAAVDGALWIDPLPSVIAVAILCAALSYFFWKTQMHRLADEVLDCGDSLKVRRGRTEQTIPLARIAAAEVASSGGFHRITIRLLEPSKFGRRVEFLPQASLWSNIDAIKQVARNLTERAQLESQVHSRV